jgi:cytochrome c oxidase assembly protein subunit 15
MASLLLLGVLLALGPALWTWRRHRQAGAGQGRRALQVLTLFLSFDLVLFGAYTRLSDSGLGCPDWPGCYGFASPIGANTSIETAQNAWPAGPVTTAKAWIEMLHRYLATAVGALISLLAALAWRDWLRQASARQASGQPKAWPRLATLTLVWVLLQGAFGALTVSTRLYPAIVSLHLLGAMVLLVLLSLPVLAASPTHRPPLATGESYLLGLGCVLLILQLALGAWVSSNDAVLACGDFPSCQGRWWPETDFAEGFTPWRALGKTVAGDSLSVAALTAIHFAHRLMALALLLVLMTLVWRLSRLRAWRPQAWLLAALTGLQIISGVITVLLGWPLLAALLHTGGAAALVLTLTALATGMWPTAPPLESAQAAATTSGQAA